MVSLDKELKKYLLSDQEWNKIKEIKNFMEVYFILYNIFKSLNIW
jgi:hypothetical protein